MSAETITDRCALLGNQAGVAIKAAARADDHVVLYHSIPNGEWKLLGVFDVRDLVEFGRLAAELPS